LEFDLRADKDDHIIVNDKRVKGRASWIDKDDGRVVYIGATEPLATPELIAVIDGALPEAVRTQLFEQLPAFMQHFAVELDPLDERPMLFVSYDLSHPKGWGRQGGVLPGQIFIHFYGNHWREEVKQPSFANDLAWHFAHEAAHLFQRHLYAREKGNGGFMKVQPTRLPRSFCEGSIRARATTSTHESPVHARHAPSSSERRDSRKRSRAAHSMSPTRADWS
jgi:hypothetical protein